MWIRIILTTLLSVHKTLQKHSKNFSVFSALLLCKRSLEYKIDDSKGLFTPITFLKITILASKSTHNALFMLSVCCSFCHLPLQSSSSLSRKDCDWLSMFSSVGEKNHSESDSHNMFLFVFFLIVGLWTSLFSYNYNDLKAQHVIFAARGHAFKINKSVIWWRRWSSVKSWKLASSSPQPMQSDGTWAENHVHGWAKEWKIY